MTARAESTAVAKVNGKNVLDLDSAKANARFLDAFTSGHLDKLKQDEQTMFLFALAAKLGLRAELGELMIYQGKPYITIDGRLRLAHESGLLVGMEPRPATTSERQHFRAAENEHLWICDVYRRGANRPFKGWGCVGPNDRNPVAKSHPRELAKKRAKYDGLRMAFPPSEYVSQMHQRYIEEAEAEIRRGQTPPALPVAGDIDYEEADEAMGTGNEDAEQAAADKAPGELPLDDRKAAQRVGVPD